MCCDEKKCCDTEEPKKTEGCCPEKTPEQPKECKEEEKKDSCCK